MKLYQITAYDLGTPDPKTFFAWGDQSWFGTQDGIHHVAISRAGVEVLQVTTSKYLFRQFTREELNGRVFPDPGDDIPSVDTELFHNEPAETSPFLQGFYVNTLSEQLITDNLAKDIFDKYAKAAEVDWPQHNIQSKVVLASKPKEAIFQPAIEAPGPQAPVKLVITQDDGTTFTCMVSPDTANKIQAGETVTLDKDSNISEVLDSVIITIDKHLDYSCYDLPYEISLPQRKLWEDTFRQTYDSSGTNQEQILIPP